VGGGGRLLLLLSQMFSFGLLVIVKLKRASTIYAIFKTKTALYLGYKYKATA
jgi:hypothetical protein